MSNSFSIQYNTTTKYSIAGKKIIIGSYTLLKIQIDIQQRYDQIVLHGDIDIIFQHVFD